MNALRRLYYACASGLLAAASLLAPRRERSGWREEWRAELWHAFRRGASLWRALSFLAGCLPDAWTLRRRKRPQQTGQRRPAAGGIETMLQDLRYALRVLCKSPGFTAAAVLTLALGIGANTAIYSVIHHVVLAPLDYPGYQRMVMLSTYNEGRGMGPMMVSGPWVAHLLEDSRALESFSAYHPRESYLTSLDEPVLLNGARLLEGMPELIGLRPHRGRSLTPDDFAPDAPDVILLGYSLWQSRYGGREGVVGETVGLDERPFSVIGVLPPDFDLPRNRAEFLTPFKVSLAEIREKPGYYLAIGRLRPGVGLPRLQQELDRFNEERAEARGGTFGFEVRAERLHDRVVGDTREPLLMLGAAVLLVLLIACANVANLLLARSARRQREASVRAALGAGRWRLARQFLLESLLLSLLGAAAALGLAAAAISALKAVGPYLPRLDEVRLSAPVLLITLALATFSALLAGVVPALRASRAESPLTTASREGALQSRTGSLPAVINVIQVALAIMLLVGAGLLMRSFQRLTSVEPGFQPRSALVAGLGFPSFRYSEWDYQSQVVQGVVERVESLPGVRSAAIADLLPLAGGWSRMILDARHTPGHLDDVSLSDQSVTPGYFQAMGIPLKGRGFTSSDRQGAQPVAIVDQRLADLFWPGQQPLGKTFQAREKEHVVVGVADSVRFYGLDEEIEPTAYFPLLQRGRSIQYLRMVVRLEEGREAAATDIRAAVRQAAPDVALNELGSFTSIVGDSVSRPRFNMILLACFAAAAVLLAAIGIFGVLSHSVSARVPEIGVRMALGADAKRILEAVVRQGMAPVLIGLALGLAGAYAATDILAAQLYNTAPTDPATFIAIPLLLAAIALAACYLPARRATKIDPVQALRSE